MARSTRASWAANPPGGRSSLNNELCPSGGHNIINCRRLGLSKMFLYSKNKIKTLMFDKKNSIFYYLHFPVSEKLFFSSIIIIIKKKKSQKARSAASDRPTRRRTAKYTTTLAANATVRTGYRAFFVLIERKDLRKSSRSKKTRPPAHPPRQRSAAAGAYGHKVSRFL